MSFRNREFSNTIYVDLNRTEDGFSIFNTIEAAIAHAATITTSINNQLLILVNVGEYTGMTPGQDVPTWTEIRGMGGTGEGILTNRPGTIITANPDAADTYLFNLQQGSSLSEIGIEIFSPANYTTAFDVVKTSHTLCLMSSCAVTEESTYNGANPLTLLNTAGFGGGITVFDCVFKGSGTGVTGGNLDDWPNLSNTAFLGGGGSTGLDVSGVNTSLYNCWFIDGASKHATDIIFTGGTTYTHNTRVETFSGAGTWINLSAGLAQVRGNYTGIDNTDSPYTAVLGGDYVIGADATAGNITINLPTAAASFINVDGAIFHIKKIDSSTNTVTIDGSGSETIDGALTKVLSIENGSIQIQSNGTSWDVLGGTTATAQKAGAVASGSFAGSPLKYTLTFATAFPDTNYSISIMPTDNRTFTYETKLAGSIIFNSNSAVALTGDVLWIAVAHGETS